MSDKEALEKLNVLIEFFKNYNNMLSDMEMYIKSEQEVRLAA
ncbi:hypothetical protein [Methylovulum sp.]|nr:hypothetical protein [Methylovulum sp.]MDD5125384.1 hypothetical protein [Methylovulum sp.]